MCVLGTYSVNICKLASFYFPRNELLLCPFNFSMYCRQRKSIPSSSGGTVFPWAHAELATGMDRIEPVICFLSLAETVKYLV